MGSVDRVHFHHLLQVKDHDPRRWIGLAKKESSHYCKVAGLAPVGGLWADGSECKPIADEGHYVNTLGYIAVHGERGAVVYMTAPVIFNPLADFDPEDLLVD